MHKYILVAVVAVLMTALQPVQAQESVLTVAVASEMTSLEGYLASSEANCNGCINVVEPLVTRDFETGEMVPYLATSWEIVDDNTLEFTLREGVTYHDGSDFNAESVAAYINYVYDPANGLPASDSLTNVITAEVVDEFTVRIVAENADPILLQKMYTVNLESGQLITDSLDEYPTTLVGTGPYMFEEWRRGEQISFVANPDWWGNDDPEAARGAIAFDRLVYRFIPDDTVRAAAAQAGEVDIAQFVTPDACEGAADLDDVRCESLASVETMFMRMGNGGFMSDIRVREAMILAVDKELIADAIMGGTATVTGQIVIPVTTGYNPDLPPYPFDPERASALLEEAAADGIDVGQPITIASREGLHPRHDEVAEAVAAMLAEVGFNTSVEVLPPDVFNPTWSSYSDDPDQPGNWIAVHLHGNEVLDLYFSGIRYFGCDGSSSLYCDEEVDAMWEAANMLSGEERDLALREVAAVAYNDFGNGIIAHLNFSYLVSEGVAWQPQLDHRIQAKEAAPAS